MRSPRTTRRPLTAAALTALVLAAPASATAMLPPADGSFMEHARREHPTRYTPATPATVPDRVGPPARVLPGPPTWPLHPQPIGRITGPDAAPADDGGGDLVPIGVAAGGAAAIFTAAGFGAHRRQWLRPRRHGAAA
jgi:hypothetical protein